jgi:hypothetical protein
MVPVCLYGFYFRMMLQAFGKSFVTAYYTLHVGRYRHSKTDQDWPARRAGHRVSGVRMPVKQRFQFIIRKKAS